MTIPGLSAGVMSVDVGLADACAVTTTGVVLCWGKNRGGELEDGTNRPSATPLPIPVPR